MTKSTILQLLPLGPPPWPTLNPFLFAVHHLDFYPKGNKNMGPDASLRGHRPGQDFEGVDGWRMYHGTSVPGFPQHPHRGFETITLARQGFIDHSDSMGATARFGEGDCQWMTAGKGVVHSEMFPLLHEDKPNTGELFQLWLNLPRKNKMVDPHFTMFWSHQIPKVTMEDEKGHKTTIAVVAGAFGEHTPPSPPPDSWASEPESAVAVWSIVMDPGATCLLPAAIEGLNRSLYVFAGQGIELDGTAIPLSNRVDVRSDMSLSLANGPEKTEILLLQGRPIEEPVVSYGPFVMNSQEDIHQTILDYQRTQFGGWPFDSDAPVHPREQGRFARHADGRLETPPTE